MVIEERNLVFPPGATAAQREIYRRYYSVQRLRFLAEKRHLADRRRHDLWLALTATFRLFEAGGPGAKLGLAPLAGELFRHGAIGALAECALGNDMLLGCLRSLSLYEHPDTRQLIRVNYAALNVEEFGSVYQGLLEYEPVFQMDQGGFEGPITFAFQAGDERAATGSHYTPEELVQPLLKHSLDHLIAERLKAANPEAALLDLRVADISCGSGHILLAAARRIATELAIVRTGEDQPSPTAYRAALRDVIRTCIYGVDLNPLAVELCKVALWLEAHNPGQPLNFLDHHIKCGNAIVGSVRREELDKGVPDEAFATLSGDDKEVAARWRKRNKAEHAAQAQVTLPYSPEIRGHLDAILSQWNALSALPERTPEEIDAKKARFTALAAGPDAFLLNQIAAIPIAQFFIPKTGENDQRLIADEQFRRYWPGGQTPQGQATALAWATAHQKRFFHWFLEFPEIMARGGFDCILGNPPYLGGQGLSGTYGHPFCAYVKWEYAPTGLSDLVVFFVRRIYSLLRPSGFTAFITTNSIKDGDIRKDGLEQVLAQGGEITMAVRGIRWPGRANLVVSLVALYRGPSNPLHPPFAKGEMCVDEALVHPPLAKGERGGLVPGNEPRGENEVSPWHGKRFLDGREVPTISAHFEESIDSGDPAVLSSNTGRLHIGTHYLGDGFVITPEERAAINADEPSSYEVIFPVMNGEELNQIPDQRANRWIIDFAARTVEEASRYKLPFKIVEERVRPERIARTEPRLRDYWWQFKRLYTPIRTRAMTLGRMFCLAVTTKYLSASAIDTNVVCSHTVAVFTTDRWDLYAVVQSTLHEVWARKYSGALETRLRYSPSDCFETFPFPEGLWQTGDPSLVSIGELYHEHRRELMLRLWLGLTDIYNLFHARDLEKRLELLFKKRAANTQWLAAIPAAHRATAAAVTPEWALNSIRLLRALHRDLDLAIRDAYGWQDLDLGHDFVEVETLAENDRVRLTIAPAARTELLRRLLALNHARTAAGPTTKKRRGKKNHDSDDQAVLSL